jgi:hypothetical protein
MLSDRDIGQLMALRDIQGSSYDKELIDRAISEIVARRRATDKERRLRSLLLQAREWVDRAQPTSEDAISDACMLLQDIDDTLRQHHNGCAIYGDGQCTCDAARYPRDAARSAVATSPVSQVIYLEQKVKKLEEALAMKQGEIDVLRGVGCQDNDKANEGPSGPCGVCIKCAYERGAAKMREGAARLFDGSPEVPGLAAMPLWAEQIRTLPTPKDGR